MEKVGDKIEEIIPEEGKVFLADPRLFKSTDVNPRNLSKDRYLKGLEDSVLTRGFRFPIVSDFNFNIISGQRRHLIALKHGLKIPVIFKRYASDVDRIIDGLLDNDPLPLTGKETALALKKLRDSGLTLEEISLNTGIPVENIRASLRSLEVEEESNIEIPEETHEKIKRRLATSERDIKEILSSKAFKSEAEKAEFILTSAELPPEELKDIAKEVKDGLNPDLSFRVQASKVGTVKMTLYLDPELYNSLSRILKKRRWDLKRLIQVLLILFTKGGIKISQEEYANESLQTGLP